MADVSDVLILLIKTSLNVLFRTSLFKLLNLKDFCESGYATYVDYHTSMRDKRNGLRDDYTYWRDDFNGYDGVHPNKKGYLKMERIISKTLKKTL